MDNKKTMFKLIKYDLRLGLWQMKVRYLIAGMVFVFICQLIIRESIDVEYSIGFWDAVYQVFQGIPEYVKDERSQFQLPVIILLFQLVLMYIVGSYPQNDMNGQGKYIMLRTGNRRKWWMSKCIWVVVSVVLYYMFFYVVMFLCLKLQNIHSSARIEDAFFYEAGVQNKMLIWLNMILLPIVTSIALGLFEMLVGFLLKVSISYAAVIVILVASAYWMSPYLIGNYLMLVRNSCFADNGIAGTQGFMINGIIICVILLAGNIFIKRCDILGGGE